VIRREGIELPYWQRIAENGWGQSVLERLWDRLVAFDSVTSGTAQLVYKAHLRTYKVQKLRELIALGGKSLEALLKQIDMIRQFQSNEGLTLMDSTDEFETHQYSFSGLSDVIDKFGEQVCGAVETPDIILFGQSPGGISNGDDTSVRIYYDSVKSDQDSNLRPGVTTLCDVISRSELGKPLPEGFAFDFVPLWQLSDTEKAEISSKDTTSVVEAFDAQIIDRPTALKELRQSSNTTGMWSNITDDDIAAAEAEPPPVIGEKDLINAPDDPGQKEKPEPGQGE
jgi:phage-related protein (TIGR01555 family)